MQLVLTEHKQEVLSVAISEDSKLVVSGSADGTIKIWDAATGDLLSTLGVDSEVLSVAFSPGGRQIVAGCVDGCIYLWRRAEDGGKKNGRFNLSARWVDRHDPEVMSHILIWFLHESSWRGC